MSLFSGYAASRLPRNGGCLRRKGGQEQGLCTKEVIWVRSRSDIVMLLLNSFPGEDLGTGHFFSVWQ